MITLCALAVAVFLASPVTPQARTPPASADADMKELAAYTLTMETLHKVDRAMRGMIADLKKDPKYAEQMKIQAELEALKKKDELTEADEKRIEELAPKLDALERDNAVNMNDAKSLSDMAAKIQKFAPMMTALQREGLTAREYAKFFSALLQAGVAAGLQKAGLLKEVPAGTNPANVKFILEHEAELQQMQQAWAALGK